MNDVLVLLCGLTSFHMLVSGASGAGSGVYVMYKGADQRITHQTGTIISHNKYPKKKYPNNVDSTLRIQVNGVLSVTLKVLFFQLEPRESSGECDDYFQINNGKKLCGDELQAGDEKTYLLKSGELELKFSTDWRSKWKGFSIQYDYFEVVTTVTTNSGSTTTAVTETQTSTAIRVTTSETTPMTTAQQPTETRKTSNPNPEMISTMSTKTAHTIGSTSETKGKTNFTADFDTQVRTENDAVAMGAGIGASILFILIAVTIALMITFKRHQEQALRQPKDGVSAPAYEHANQAYENTLSIRMSASQVNSDAENDYTLSDPAESRDATANGFVAPTLKNDRGAGDTNYDMAEQVETIDDYQLADDGETSSSEYTLAEEITPKTTREGAQPLSEEKGYEDDSTAEDYANLEAIQRAEEEKMIEELYSSVLVTTKTMKTKSDPGATELVENELYGSLET